MEVFTHRFVELYNHFIYLTKKENDNKFNLHLENYGMEVFHDSNFTYVLLISNNGKKLLEMTSKWGTDFYKPKIIVFNSESVFELQEFHNMFVDLIQQKLNQREEENNNFDLKNLALKELL
ncbi:MAG: hypothetical protein KAQ93_07785 [Spirochaetales bacterium]|nr:hypothetical protein [Spirochaetales bacterium]